MSRKSVKEMRMPDNGIVGNGRSSESRSQARLDFAESRRMKAKPTVAWDGEQRGDEEGRPCLRRWGLRVIHHMN